MPRTASAPAGLRAKEEDYDTDSPSSKDEESSPSRRGSTGSTPEPRSSRGKQPKAPVSGGAAAADTDVDSDSTCSFGESRYACSMRSSPLLDTTASSPILAAVARQVAQPWGQSSTPAGGASACGTAPPGDAAAGAKASEGLSSWMQDHQQRGDVGSQQAYDEIDWMLPDSAWSGASQHNDLDQGCFSDCVEMEMYIEEGGCHSQGPGQSQAQVVGTPMLGPAAGPWMAPQSNMSSPMLSCQNSPLWSFAGSPMMLAQVSPMASPQMLPQGAIAVQVPASWLQQAQQSWAVHRHSPQSQQSSPQASPKMSPQMSPQMSPMLSPMLAPLLSPPMAPQNGGPVPELSLSALEADPTLGWPSSPPQAHTISHKTSLISGVHRIIWTVDAGKLRNHERQAVSPSFELPLASLATSRLVIFPRPNTDGKGSASFKKSGGCGSVHLKCEASGGSVSFLVAISDGTTGFDKKPRGPVMHNFADHSTCGLSKDQEQWDFGKAVNQATQTFSVCLDILPCRK